MKIVTEIMQNLQCTSAISDIVMMLAIVVAGIWALHRYAISREHATNLFLQATYDTHYFQESTSTVFVTVRLENRGKSKLSAKPGGKGTRAHVPAYKDHVDTLNFACGIQFRELTISQKFGHISWHDLQDTKAIGELNILKEFETLDESSIDFHLEPGEIVEITIPVHLPKAHYIAKIHFIGAGDNMEYWSKLFLVRAAGEQG
jgi:hypothetical protein